MNYSYRRGVNHGRGELAQEIIRIVGNEELSNEQILALIIEEVEKNVTFCGYTSSRGY